jgi:hypothetical protein
LDADGLVGRRDPRAARAGGMRREAAALPRGPFERLTDRLHQRYRWR